MHRRRGHKRRHGHPCKEEGRRGISATRFATRATLLLTDMLLGFGPEELRLAAMTLVDSTATEAQLCQVRVDVLQEMLRFKRNVIVSNIENVIRDN